MELEKLKQQIKELIISECDKEDDLEWHEIEDEEALFGSRSKIGLDSLDALQLSLAVKENFGVTIDGSRSSKKYFESVNTLANYILKERNSL